MAAMTHEITVYDEDYPARRLLELIGDKWTPIIVYILGQGTKRYGEMQRHLPGVSKKMLTQTLRALERNGLLNRKVYAEVPPRVDYSLTRGACGRGPCRRLRASGTADDRSSRTDRE